VSERKRPRRTRERIVETSLSLFNEHGAPHVTTADIAAEMGISPGNLYYHFRNKDEIAAEFFDAFERRLEGLLSAPVGRPGGVEDLWFFLHLLFEAMWDYRFIYRDLDDNLSRDRRLALRFARVIERGKNTVIELCRSMVTSGAMRASERDIAAIAENVALVATYWISYQKISSKPHGESAGSLGRAAYQVLSLIAPYLEGSDRALLERLSRDYL